MVQLQEPVEPTMPTSNLTMQTIYPCEGQADGCENFLPGDGDWFNHQYWYDGAYGVVKAGWYCDDCIEGIFMGAGLEVDDTQVQREFASHVAVNQVQWLQDKYNIIVFPDWQPTGATCAACGLTNVVESRFNEVTGNQIWCARCYKAKLFAGEAEKSAENS